MNQNGFSQLILLVIIGAVLIIGGGGFWYYEQSANQNESVSQTQTVNSDQTAVPQENQEQGKAEQNESAGNKETDEEIFVPAKKSKSESISELPNSPSVVTKISWVKDGGVRVTGGSVPFIHKLKEGKVRLYYCSGSEGILSSVSNDGLTFSKEPEVRIAPGAGFELIVCDPTIVNLPNGGVRMYYKGANNMNPGPGQSIHKIFSAISSDGLLFQKEGLRIDSETNGDNGWASVPDAITLPDGRVRIYYVTAAAMEHGIGSAVSSDGLTFKKESGLRVPNLVDPALVKLGDKYVLFAASIDERFAALPKGIYYVESSDGLTFGKPMTVFQENNVYDPTVLKIDENTLRVFYGKIAPPQLPATESHTGHIVN